MTKMSGIVNGMNGGLGHAHKSASLNDEQLEDPVIMAIACCTFISCLCPCVCVRRVACVLLFSASKLSLHLLHNVQIKRGCTTRCRQPYQMTWKTTLEAFLAAAKLIWLGTASAVYHVIFVECAAVAAISCEKPQAIILLWWPSQGSKQS